MERPSSREFEKEERESLAAFQQELSYSTYRYMANEIDADMYETYPTAMFKHDLRTGIKKIGGKTIPARRVCSDWNSRGDCSLGTLCTFRHSYSHDDPRRALGPMGDDSDSRESFDEDAD